MLLDPRIVRVGVEVQGQLRVYADGWITATGTKFASALQNEVTVQIANLNRDVRHYLLTETSPYNENRTPKRLIVEAGRESIGTSEVFVGDITECVVSQPPDIVLTLKAKTKQASKGDIVALSSAQALEPLSGISARVAKQLDLTLLFEALEQQMRNFTFTGSSLALVKKLGEAAAVNAYVDDRLLVVKNWNQPLVGTSHVLSVDTGMIGIPEATEYGAKVKMLFDPRVKLGGRLQIRSAINPAMDGSYTIYKLDFELTTRDTPFYWTAHCTRDGWKNAKLVPEPKPSK